MMKILLNHKQKKNEKTITFFEGLFNFDKKECLFVPGSQIIN